MDQAALNQSQAPRTSQEEDEGDEEGHRSSP